MSVAWQGRRLVGPAAGLATRGATLLVCVHANGFCKELWRPVLDSLERRLEQQQRPAADARTAAQPLGEVHALAMDLPGHGDSATFAPPLEMAVFGRAVLHALDAYAAQARVKFSNVVGVGHSIGSTTLLCAELLRPRRFDSLFLVEAILSPTLRDDGAGDGDNPISRMTLKRRRTFASREAARANWHGKGSFAGWTEEALDLYVEHGLRADGLGGWTLKCAPEQEAAVFRVDRDAQVNNLDKIPCPVTWLNTLASTGHVPAEAALQTFRRFAHGREIVLLPRLNHFMPFQGPDIVAEHLAGHLRATLPGSCDAGRSRL
jgi:pimeloyl-ACP methyl ester carboxylesterase